MLLTKSFLSFALEVSFIFIGWLLPTQSSIYFHLQLNGQVEWTLGDIIFIQSLCVTVSHSLAQSVLYLGISS
jgi:hypothetical protein